MKRQPDVSVQNLIFETTRLVGCFLSLDQLLLENRKFLT